MFNCLIFQDAKIFKFYNIICDNYEINTECSYHECIKKITNSGVDVFIIDITSIIIDRDFLLNIIKCCKKKEIIVVCCVDQLNNDLIIINDLYQAADCFIKSNNLDLIIKTLINLDLSKKDIVKDEKIDEVHQLLYQLGISNSVNGFYYLQSAIIMCLKNKSLLKGFNCGLYQNIAFDFNTTPSAVEKAIRKSIENAFNYSNATSFIYCFFKDIINNDKAKATNRQFILMCVQYLK